MAEINNHRSHIATANWMRNPYSATDGSGVVAKETKRSMMPITRLARANGLSVAALKRILQSEGYLEGKDPTPTALERGVAELRDIDPSVSRYGSDATTFPVWDRDIVNELVESSGNADNRGLGVWSVHNAAERLGEAAELIFPLVDKASGEVYFRLGWCQFETVEILAYAQEHGRRGTGVWVEQRLAAILLFCDDQQNKDRPEVAQARKLFTAVLEWFAKGR